jgi:hypothetical protein
MDSSNKDAEHCRHLTGLAAKPPREDSSNAIKYFPTNRQDLNYNSSINRIFPLYRIKVNNLIDYLLTPRSKETQPLKVYT